MISFGEHEGAVFGYCGKGRNRHRHHPLVASVAGPRTVVHADYRDGTAIKEGETITFPTETLRRVRCHLREATVLLRADSGFWSRAVGEWLLANNLSFVFAMPLHAGLKLLILNTPFRTLEGDADVEVAEISGSLLNLDPRLRVAGLRRRVHDRSAPPGKPEELWRLYNGRADCERVFKVAKHALGVARLISHDVCANHGAFLLRLLAYNADILFQIEQERQAAEAHRQVLRIGLVARQHRFYNTAGRLLRAANAWILRVACNLKVEQLFAFYAPELTLQT